MIPRFGGDKRVFTVAIDLPLASRHRVVHSRRLPIKIAGFSSRFAITGTGSVPWLHLSTICRRPDTEIIASSKFPVSMSAWGTYGRN